MLKRNLLLSIGKPHFPMWNCKQIIFVFTSFFRHFDAGASPTHQVSQRGSGGQLDKPGKNLKLPSKLLRKS